MKISAYGFLLCAAVFALAACSDDESTGSTGTQKQRYICSVQDICYECPSEAANQQCLGVTTEEGATGAGCTKTDVCKY